MSRSFNINEALSVAAKNDGVAVIPDESGNRATAYFLTPAAYQAMASPPVKSKKPTRGERKRRARERHLNEQRERERLKFRRRLFS